MGFVILAHINNHFPKSSLRKKQKDQPEKKKKTNTNKNVESKKFHHYLTFCIRILSFLPEKGNVKEPPKLHKSEAKKLRQRFSQSVFCWQKSKKT